MRYWITCKDGYVLTDERGCVVEDHVGRDYVRLRVDVSWRIVGIARRFNSVDTVTLAEAADGADIGHGFIHDEQNGTRRIWTHPATRRAVKVTRIP